MNTEEAFWDRGRNLAVRTATSVGPRYVVTYWDDRVDGETPIPAN